MGKGEVKKRIEKEREINKKKYGRKYSCMGMKKKVFSKCLVRIRRIVEKPEIGIYVNKLPFHFPLTSLTKKNA